MNMRRIRKPHLRELLFRVSVLLKGLDGALEIAGGIALWAVSPEWIVRVVGWLTQDEIAEDPHDPVANYLRHATHHFTLGTEHFMAIYLLGHGTVKLFVVGSLLRNKRWAYPVALVVFGGFALTSAGPFTPTLFPVTPALGFTQCQ